MDLEVIVGRVVVGLIVGTLVGLTGLGGGVVLLPILISVLGIPPILAVGSDAAINCVTKIGAGALHWRLGNVNWKLALNLGCGSIPGAILGVTYLGHLRSSYGSGVNEILKVAIAVLLIVIPLVYLLKGGVSETASPGKVIQNNRFRLGIVLIGLLAGILVGITSIGSGSVVLIMLLIFYGYAPGVMVGTDIVHAIALAGVTAMLQFRLGNIDMILVTSVLIGSVPGGLLGTYLTKRLPTHRLKQILCAVLIVVGARALWKGVVHAY